MDVAGVGRHNKADPADGYEAFTIIEKIQHPSYDPVTISYDFMVLKLNGTAETEPIQLNSDNTFPPSGHELTIIGWGDTDPSYMEHIPDVLQQVTVNYISNDKCEKSKSPLGNGSYRGLIQPAMMCAFDANEDSCQGDSGGPLLALGADIADDVLVGVVSWYVYCLSKAGLVRVHSTTPDPRCAHTFVRISLFCHRGNGCALEVGPEIVRKNTWEQHGFSTDASSRCAHTKQEPRLVVNFCLLTPYFLFYYIT